MAAPLAEVPVGQTGKTGLLLSDRFDDEVCFLDEIVLTSADDRVTLRIGNNSAFKRRSIHPFPTTSWLLKDVISSAVKPNSRRTSSVCCPSAGG